MSKKYLVKKAILNVIRDSEPVSRTGIKNIINLRMATIIEIVKELIADGIVIESGSMGGTELGKKKFLFLNAGKHSAIGVNIQSDRAASVSTDLRGKIIGRTYEKIYPSIGKDSLLNIIYSVIDKQLKEMNIDDVLGIGISNPGILNREKDRVIFSSQFENWRDIPIKRLLEERYKIPAYIEDSAVVSLLAEKRFGKAERSDNVIFIHMGASFGISIISNGIFVRGVSGMAGEIGHMMVEPGGELCVCGNRGCLQTVASTSAIEERVSGLLEKGAYSLLDHMHTDIGYIEKAASEGDKICMGALEEAGRYIGIALSNTINLLNPEMIIFGGDTAGNSVIIGSAKRVIDADALYLARKDLIYENSSFDGNGGDIGAAAMVLDKYFEGKADLR